MAPLQSDKDEGEASHSYDEGEGSYSYDEGEKKFDEGEKSYSYDNEESWDDEESMTRFTAVAIGVLLLLILILAWLKRDSLFQAWHRRQAARAAKGLGRGEELKPVESWFAGTTKPVKVLITCQGQTHTIGASRDSFSSVTQLPFALTDACVESGFPEISTLSVVDLCIQRKATLSYEGGDGRVQAVHGSTTLDDLLVAKAIHVIVSESADVE